MIKRIVPVFMFVILFFGLTLPQNSNAVFEPNLNAAQTKPAPKGAGAKPTAKAVAKPAVKKSNPASKNIQHANAKYRAIQKIREAQNILDRSFGSGAVRVNTILNGLNRNIELIKLIRN